MGKQLAQPEVRAAIASPLGEAEALAERAFLLEDTMHILICDDDAVFAARVETLVRDFFARRGLQVECTVCHSGEETLARRDLDLYQVALLDVDLDTMNGTHWESSCASAARRSAWCMCRPIWNLPQRATP